MENSQYYLLIAIAFTLYLAFAFIFTFANRKLLKPEKKKTFILAPILFSFFVGISFLFYALSDL